jgi:hypothetical protein
MRRRNRDLYTSRPKEEVHLSGYERHRHIMVAIRAEGLQWVFPVMFGELAIMLWLIIMGAEERQPQASAA